MQQSDQINDFAAALALAQGAMDHASKDSLNPAFNRKYADLASVVSACRAALSSNGIAVVQPARTIFGDRSAVVEVDTRLVHKSGQWMAETLAATVTDTKAQSIGTAITYLRRYGLCAMTGVAPDDDDDGNAASGHGGGDRDRKPERQPKARNDDRPSAPTTAPQAAEPATAAAPPKPPEAKTTRTPQEVCARLVTQIRDIAGQGYEGKLRAEVTNLLGDRDPAKLDTETAKALLGTPTAPGPLRALRDRVQAHGAPTVAPAAPTAAPTVHPTTPERLKLIARISSARRVIAREHPGAVAEADALVGGRPLDTIDTGALEQLSRDVDAVFERAAAAPAPARSVA